MGASDYFVGNSPGGASYASPLIGFQLGEAIGNLPKDRFEATQRQRTLDMQRAFPNGMPTDANGQPDVNAIINKGMTIGGLEYAGPLMQLLMQQKIGQQQGQNLLGIDGLVNGGGNGAPAAPNGPVNSPAAAGPGNLRPQPQAAQPQRPALSSAGTDNQGSDTLRSVATEIAGGREITPLISGVARQLRLNPDAPLNPQQVAQVKEALRGVALPPMPQNGQPQQLASQDGGGAPMTALGGVSGGPGPSAEPAAASAPLQPRPVQTVQAGPAPAQGGGVAAGIVPAGTDPRLYADRLRMAATRARASAAQIAPYNAATATQYEKQADAYESRAKLIDETTAKERELTPDQKNAAASGLASPAALKGREKLEEKVGEGIAKPIEETLDAGRSAQKRIQSLATIGDALKRGQGNITTGPFAETVLKGKQFLSSALNIDLDGKTEAEVIQKMSFQLATQAVKEISSRPTQMEFQRALQNNPGLLMSPQGSVAMIDILTQTARQDVELAKLAQKRENWDRWQDVQDDYYAKHPIMSPFDRKRPLGAEDVKIMAQGAPEQEQGSPLKASAGAPKWPDVGAVVSGHRFKGGNPNDKASWELVR